VIKSAYIYQARRNTLVSWKRILSWAERLSLESVRHMSPKERYRDTKDLLVRLSAWYHDCYLEGYCDPGIVNLPVTLNSEATGGYSDTIDIVTVGEKLRLFDFVEASPGDYSGTKVYRDVEVWARIWGFKEASRTKPEEYVRLVIGPQTIKPVKITVLQSMLERGQKMMQQIMRGIEGEVFYPSFSEQCANCPHTQVCGI
jgi:hypothetical protein